MDDKLELFRAALGLPEPWRVVETKFDPVARRLDLHLDFAPGTRFPCPEGDEAACPVHDTTPKTWRHLDFIQQSPPSPFLSDRRYGPLPAQPGGIADWA